jgi:hypothetical protein
MKNRCKSLVAIFFIWLNAQSQQTYFQQEVNYKIQVELNDKEHTLKANSEIQYINNSSTSLNYIYFHLWPNAYKNNQTALAKQLLKLKRTDFYYSSNDDKGYIDSLDFKVNGRRVKWEYDKEHIDIARIYLEEPLRSLDTIVITTPFFVKVPSSKFSRLGHDKQAYYITQWYPKPAVFDADGWHPMPYLDQGEFYSEYGSFDVSVTLPQNYVLAGTGDRIDADEEEDFLNNKVGEALTRIDRGIRDYDMSFPPSSANKKTVRFKQFRVHDFAWFADKRFNVLHDQIKLPNTGKVVDTWVYFTNREFSLWKDALDYVNESTLFYSYMLGDYPYNNVSAVDGQLMAGGGMEYPNITVIGSINDPVSLDITIAHEVGHNWFYGILGSNEREYPALDEGLNSFYEMSYVRAKYPNMKLGENFGLDSTRKIFGINKFPYWKEKELAYYLSAKSNLHQPLNTPAAEFSSFNYGAMVYSKMAVMLDYLHDYMGDEAFNKAMQFYYENFKFKHPKPNDLFQTLQYFSGNDLSWFSNYLFNTNATIDYKLKSVRRQNDGSYILKVKNKTGTPVPFNIYGFKDKRPVGLVWYNGSDTNRRISFPPSDVDYFKIDGLDLMPDMNRRNNYIRARGLFKKVKRFDWSILTKMPDPTKNQIHVLPIAGFNLYNGWMGGLSIHNYGIFDKQLEIQVSPMYAFRSKTITGFADVNMNLFPESFFRKISIGANAKSFSFARYQMKNLDGNNQDLNLHYYRLSPHLIFEFQNSDKTSRVKRQLAIKHHFIFEDQLRYSVSTIDPSVNYFYSGNQLRQLTTVDYAHYNNRAINPYNYRLSMHTDGKMSKVFTEYNQNINISAHNQFQFRLFAGVFLQGNDSDKGMYRFRLSGFNGYHDYLYESNFVGRNEFTGFAFSQFSENDGAFKIWTPLGQSTDYLITLNMKSPRIWKLPLRVFMDIGTAGSSSLNKEKVLWAGGINLSVVNNVIDVYLPLLYSNEIKETLTLNNVSFPNTIRFTFNLHQIKPKEMILNTFQ